MQCLFRNQCKHISYAGGNGGWWVCDLTGKEMEYGNLPVACSDFEENEIDERL